jgi:hypothetical protein
MHGNATMRSVSIVEPYVAINNMKLIRVYMETQQWVPCALFSCYEIFPAVDKHIIRSSCKVSDIFVRFFKKKFGSFLTEFNKSPEYQISLKCVQLEPS